MAEHLIRQAVPDDISILCDLDQIARSSSDRRDFIQDAVQNSRAWVVEICDRIIGYGVISHQGCFTLLLEKIGWFY
ncbi:hypothetical protein [Acaryochloris sp. CCMEE 5410]|uniref:hypothetical protein n=1 Tax=Acaryochloris sp. CCMEE 5410 TaxID=310037 RepID=UPI0021D03F60|nr:hypothetical protein [Acaryochloris sp. CCMEE 5410]